MVGIWSFPIGFRPIFRGELLVSVNILLFWKQDEPKIPKHPKVAACTILWAGKETFQNASGPKQLAPSAPGRHHQIPPLKVMETAAFQPARMGCSIDREFWRRLWACLGTRQCCVASGHEDKLRLCCGECQGVYLFKPSCIFQCAMNLSPPMRCI